MKNYMIKTIKPEIPKAPANKTVINFMFSTLIFAEKLSIIRCFTWFFMVY